MNYKRPDEKRLRKKVRLYHFFNINVGKNGEPFSMCDFHAKDYNVPLTCVMHKIANDSLIPCDQCAGEEITNENH